jgi:hypothetical protein
MPPTTTFLNSIAPTSTPRFTTQPATTTGWEKSKNALLILGIIIDYIGLWTRFEVGKRTFAVAVHRRETNFMSNHELLKTFWFLWIHFRQRTCFTKRHHYFFIYGIIQITGL